MQADPVVLLADIDQAGEDIEMFIEGHDTESYAADPMVQAAVERKFGIIGEAVNRLHQLHPEIAEKIPEMRKIVNFRNVLVHGYAHVVPELVWDYAQNHLPDLRATVRTLVFELRPPKY